MWHFWLVIVTGSTVELDLIINESLRLQLNIRRMYEIILIEPKSNEWVIQNNFNCAEKNSLDIVFH